MKTMMAEFVTIRIDSIELPGRLVVPEKTCGMVIFAHGSGSSRRSPRNQRVAAKLVKQGCATLLFDLLADKEAVDRRNVFDIELLGTRVVGATHWLREQAGVCDLPIGYFGASTGSAAALHAAAELGDQVAAVVSRGGRPDLASKSLALVAAPTLLIVGSKDRDVLRLNIEAKSRLTCPSKLSVIEGATHLFEELGTLDAVAAQAGEWFVKHFAHAV